MISILIHFALAVNSIFNAEPTLMTILGGLTTMYDLIIKIYEKKYSKRFCVPNKFTNCISLKTYLFLSIFNQLR